MFARVSATIFQLPNASGYTGLPSNTTGVAPAKGPSASQFQTIQLVELKKYIRSPARMSDPRFNALRCSRTMPPWLWTIPLGTPVVPDENRIHSGWLNGSGANSGSWGSATASAHEMVVGSSLLSSDEETMIVARKDGRACCSRSTTDRRS